MHIIDLSHYNYLKCYACIQYSVKKKYQILLYSQIIMSNVIIFSKTHEAFLNQAPCTKFVLKLKKQF